MHCKHGPDYNMLVLVLDLYCRPTFKQIVQRLENMLRQNRLAKKRSASGPPATGCATSTPESQG
jgi:hypothetical protein